MYIHTVVPRHASWFCFWYYYCSRASATCCSRVAGRAGKIPTANEAGSGRRAGFFVGVQEKLPHGQAGLSHPPLFRKTFPTPPRRTSAGISSTNYYWNSFHIPHFFGAVRVVVLSCTSNVCGYNLCSGLRNTSLSILSLTPATTVILSRYNIYCITIDR